MAAVKNILLSENWSWKQRDPDVASLTAELDLPQTDTEATSPQATAQTATKTHWRRTYASGPSEIHVELLKQGLIPDPYLKFNEHKVQWIGEVEWLYKTTFDEITPGERALLTFEGLDTICDVYLNGTKILSADNQFRTYTYPIPHSAQNPTHNVLFLHFKSAAKIAKALEAEYGRVRAGSANLGDPSRVYVRKAQYDWRWDWGPELMAVGPYRAITLTTYATARIVEVRSGARVAPSPSLTRSLAVDVTLDSLKPTHGTIRVELKDLAGNVLRSHTSESANVIWDFKDEEIDLWWPVGYGKQPLYDVVVTLFSENTPIDTHKTRIGFRHVELIQDVLAEPDIYGRGSSFLFAINGVRVFIGGSNWIPADNFLTTITPARYRAWLQLLVDGNQNMVRLWGGGVYEPDVFYDICDELGILVWQDFQFACGVYPAHEAFVESVRREAEDNVGRLRHHPAMAVFCGNNEDYQMVLQWGDVPTLPATLLYESVLPSVVAALTDPPIPYHPGSPYGIGKGSEAGNQTTWDLTDPKTWDTADPTVGDVHQWNVWGGKERPYQEYDVLGGRFVSEFGMPSLPSMQTIRYFMDDAPKREWYAQSPLIAQHTRAGMFERRFAIAMNENFRVTADLETQVFNTQMMQAEAVGYAYQVWRRKWCGLGKEYTSGVIVWQLNDCWPVASWAIVDYFLRPKPAYYAIKRQMAPQTVNVYRTIVKNKPNDRPKQFYEFGAFQSYAAHLDIWGTNSTLKAIPSTLHLTFVDLYSEWTHIEPPRQVVLLPNQSTELLTSFPCAGPPREAAVDGPPSGDPNWTTSYSVIVHAKLVNEDGVTVIAQVVDWPQPYRYLELPDPGLTVAVTGDGDGTDVVELAAGRPVKGVFLSVEGDGAFGSGGGKPVKWSDNAVDVMPGDKRLIRVEGLMGRKIGVSYLGKERVGV